MPVFYFAFFFFFHFSFGILVNELFSGAAPWEGLDLFAVMDKVKSGERPPIAEGLDEKMRALIESCWNQDLAKRPTAADVVSTLQGFSFLLFLSSLSL